MMSLPALLFLTPFAAAILMPGWRWLAGFALAVCALIAGALICNVLYPPSDRGANMAVLGPLLFGASAALGFVARSLRLWLRAPEASPFARETLLAAGAVLRSLASRFLRSIATLRDRNTIDAR